MQVVNINMPLGNLVAGQTIAGGGNWKSGVIFSDGYQFLTVAVQINTAGTLVITRYVDIAGTMARPASSTTIVANTLLIVDITDSLPFLSFQIEVDNTSGGTATVASFSVIMNAT